jgi:hypothetical protein
MAKTQIIDATRAKKTKQVIVKQTEQSPAEKLAWTKQWIEQDLASTVERGREEVAAWTAKIANNKDNPFGEVRHALEWAQGIANTAAYAFRVQKVLMGIEYLKEQGKDDVQALVEALQHEVKVGRDELINDNLRGSSTSAFHNATEHANRAATSDFVRHFGSRLEFLERAVWQANNDRAVDAIYVP